MVMMSILTPRPSSLLPAAFYSYILRLPSPSPSFHYLTIPLSSSSITYLFLCIWLSRADNEGVGKGISMGIWSEWSEEIPIPEVPEQEDEDDEDEGIGGEGDIHALDGKEDGNVSPLDSNSDEDSDDYMDDDVLNAVQVRRSNLPTTRRGGVQLADLRLPGDDEDGKVDEKEEEKKEEAGRGRRGGIQLNAMNTFGSN